MRPAASAPKARFKTAVLTYLVAFAENHAQQTVGAAELRYTKMVVTTAVHASAGQWMKLVQLTMTLEAHLSITQNQGIIQPQPRARSR